MINLINFSNLQDGTVRYWNIENSDDIPMVLQTRKSIGLRILNVRSYLVFYFGYIMVYCHWIRNKKVHLVSFILLKVVIESLTSSSSCYKIAYRITEVLQEIFGIYFQTCGSLKSGIVANIQFLSWDYWGNALESPR